MKTAIFAQILARTGFRSLLGRAAPWSGILVLNYHRIGSAAGSPFDHGLWSADEAAFDAQVKFLKGACDVVSPDDLPDILSRRKGRYVLVTFDDGYRDNYTAAFPILKRHGVPATFFLATGFLDHPRLPWWDEIAWMVRTCPRDRIEVRPWVAEPVVFDPPERERAVRTLLRTYKSIPSERTPDFLAAVRLATGSGSFDHAAAKDLWMTWDMVREMRAAGMAIGGHTVNHPILGTMPPDRQWEEISTCGERLAAELGEPMNLFSYPVGNRGAFNDDTRACLRRAGVRYAFSYCGGFRRFDEWDDYDIRRVAVETYLTGDWFRAIVTLPRLFAHT
jgi:peptidoglycan/xylan/chitin deacetylase (PgdA/CDA1 family)